MHLTLMLRATRVLRTLHNGTSFDSWDSINLATNSTNIERYYLLNQCATNDLTFGLHDMCKISLLWDNGSCEMMCCMSSSVAEDGSRNSILPRSSNWVKEVSSCSHWNSLTVRRHGFNMNEAESIKTSGGIFDAGWVSGVIRGRMVKVLELS